MARRRLGLRQLYFAASGLSFGIALLTHPPTSWYAWGAAGGLFVVAWWTD